MLLAVDVGAAAFQVEIGALQGAIEPQQASVDLNVPA